MAYGSVVLKHDFDYIFVQKQEIIPMEILGTRYTHLLPKMYGGVLGPVVV